MSNYYDKLRSFDNPYNRTFIPFLDMGNPFTLPDDIKEVFPTMEGNEFHKKTDIPFNDFTPVKLYKVSSVMFSKGFALSGMLNYFDRMNVFNTLTPLDSAKVMTLTNLLVMQSLYNTDVCGYHSAENNLNLKLMRYCNEKGIETPNTNIRRIKYSHTNEIIDSMFNGRFIIPDNPDSGFIYMTGLEKSDNGFFDDVSEIYSNLDKIITEKANEHGYHLITRYRLSYNELVEKYGHNLIFKISKRAYYVAGRGIWLSPYVSINRYTEDISGPGYFTESIFENSFISSEFMEFAKNNLGMFNEWINNSIVDEKIKSKFIDYTSKIISSNTKFIMQELISEILSDYIDLNVELLKDIKKEIVQKRIFNRENITFNISDRDLGLIASDAERYANAIRDNYNKKINLLVQYTLSKTEIDTSIGDKALKFIKTQYNINKNFIDKIILGKVDGTWALQITNKFIPVTYIEHQSLENILKRAPGEIIPLTPNSTKYVKRKQALMDVVNDKNEIYIIPNVVTILFKNRLAHYIMHNNRTYKEFIDPKVKSLLRQEDLFNNDTFINCRNHHANYGNNTEFGNVGCTGSFSTAFSDAESSYNLNKELALCLQYVRTLVPFDYAGNSSIIHCFVCDKETKEIVSASHIFGDFFERNRCKIENGVMKLFEEDNKSDNTPSDPADNIPVETVPHTDTDITDELTDEDLFDTYDEEDLTEDDAEVADNEPEPEDIFMAM